MNLDKELKKTEAELASLQKEHEERAARIRWLQRRIAALRLLKGPDDPEAGGIFLGQSLPTADDFKSIAAPLSKVLLRIFEENPGVPMHTADLVGKLAEAGKAWVPGQAAPIVATAARRLARRGLLKKAKKDTYVAWAYLPK